MGRRAALAVVALLLLAGCAPQHALPKTLSDSEIMAILTEQQLQWWRGWHPGETPPVVEVVEYVDPFSPSDLMDECLRAANIPGVTIDSGGWRFEATDRETEKLFNNAQYICRMKYQYDPAYADQMGILSDEQLEYLYYYSTERLVPCVELMGYGLREVPSHEVFMASAPYLTWTPYDVMMPIPDTAEEWERVDARCPPPAIGHFWRPGIDY